MATKVGNRAITPQVKLVRGLAGSAPSSTCHVTLKHEYVPPVVTSVSYQLYSLITSCPDPVSPETPARQGGIPGVSRELVPSRPAIPSSQGNFPACLPLALTSDSFHGQPNRTFLFPVFPSSLLWVFLLPWNPNLIALPNAPSSTKPSIAFPAGRDGTCSSSYISLLFLCM